MAAEPPRSNLPAPYRNPWGLLASDLRAVVADLVLRLREGWRRNREGTLWRPRWWPADLAPLFWPLALAGLFAAVLALCIAVRAWWPLSTSPPPAPRPEPPPAPQSAMPLAPTPLLEVPASPVGSTDLGSAPELEPVHKPELEPEPEADTNNLEVEMQPQPEDPLRALLLRPESNGLLRDARADLDRSTLLLQVAPAFPALAEAEQLRRAEQWQQWANELGYDHLELRDSRAGLLARDALVGSGMIVLSEPDSALARRSPR